MNRITQINLTGKLQFGDIPIEVLTEHFKDGRWASTLLERYIPILYPELVWVSGNKDHDHIDAAGNQYDLKCFTKGGLKFMPSNQIGSHRSFDAKIAHDKARKLTYICCDITQFPLITVKFANGNNLIEKYPKCLIPFKDREAFFSSIDETATVSEVSRVHTGETNSYISGV
jgi:hypothetical protein